MTKLAVDLWHGRDFGSTIGSEAKLDDGEDGSHDVGDGNESESHDDVCDPCLGV